MRLFSFYMTSPLPSAASLADDIASDVPAPFELAVVMPCLDEADTLAICIKKAQAAMSEHGISGEVIIADNGSSDDSIKIAEELGARVVRVEEKGYGNALRGGISASRSKYVIMGDADDSYDFLEIPRFVEKLRLGHELVQGCRLPRGGGCIAPGAMPWLPVSLIKTGRSIRVFRHVYMTVCNASHYSLTLIFDSRCRVFCLKVSPNE